MSTFTEKSHSRNTNKQVMISGLRFIITTGDFYIRNTKTKQVHYFTPEQMEILKKFLASGAKSVTPKPIIEGNLPMGCGQ